MPTNQNQFCICRRMQRELGGKLGVVHVIVYLDDLKEKKIYTRVCEDDC